MTSFSKSWYFGWLLAFSVGCTSVSCSMPWFVDFHTFHFFSFKLLNNRMLLTLSAKFIYVPSEKYYVDPGGEKIISNISSRTTLERLSFFRKWHSLCDSTGYPLVALQAKKCHNWPFSMGIHFLSYCYWRIVTVNSYCYWSVTEEYLWFGKGCSWSHPFIQKASSCSCQLKKGFLL